MLSRTDTEPLPLCRWSAARCVACAQRGMWTVTVLPCHGQQRPVMGRRAYCTRLAAHLLEVRPHLLQEGLLGGVIGVCLALKLSLKLKQRAVHEANGSAGLLLYFARLAGAGLCAAGCNAQDAACACMHAVKRLVGALTSFWASTSVTLSPM